MSNDLVIDAATFENVIGQIGAVIATNRWVLAPPPANTMRGVDFYNATDFLSALLRSAVLFREAHGHLPQFASPTIFNEHIVARKFFAPLPLPSLGDKLGVRDYVRQRLGEEALIPVVWIGERVDDLFTADLPTGRFVLKPNHGFDMNLYLDLPQDLTARREEIEVKGQAWLGARFGYELGEWHYSVIKPKLFLETFLTEDGVDSMGEFKVHCFHGKARAMHIIAARDGAKRHGTYTTDWTYLPDAIAVGSIEFERPKNFDLLIETAERLAQGLEYARVDLYTDFKQFLKAGEITLTPGDGRQPFVDVEFARWLGGWFTPAG
jgi:hypothetical protein